MKIILSIIFFFLVVTNLQAQDSTMLPEPSGKVTVIKDPRLDILARKEYEFNSMGMKSAKGYRLLVISSNDQDKVMAIRSKLLQEFPDQKVYTTFMSPNIKLRFGNFVEKAEAERFRDLLGKMKIVTNNVYVVPEVVEVKPDKTKIKEDE